MKTPSRTELSEDRELCSLRNSMYPELIRQEKGQELENQRIECHPAGFPAFLMACRVERIED